MSLPDDDPFDLLVTGSPQPHMRLGDLLTLVQCTIADHLPDAYWIVAEVAEFKTSPRGYTHFTLIEKKAESLVAKAPAVMWRQASQSALPRFRAATGAALGVGMNVLLKVTVQFHVQYGLQLEILDIDASYTLGEMARQRKEVLDRLEREGRIDRNKRLPFPLVPQKIALVSSKTAAGYEDFVHQVTTNAYGFAFRHELFQCLMQGSGAPAQIVAAFESIGRLAHRFDVVVVIRGGGSSVDLSVFDDYSIGAAISDCPLPVITGIGHERDESVADACAYARAKTPTAAAELVIGTVRAFAERLELASATLSESARRRIIEERSIIDDASKALSRRAASITEIHHGRLDRAGIAVASASRRIIDRNDATLKHLDTAIRLLDPENVLRRGYSITFHDGHAVRGLDGVAPGDLLTTRVFGGTIESQVAGVHLDEENE
ncbi:MAG: exodeoxyribonuclease VII large subunit [Capsulimonadaceae bacterium]|nr:exodeoxyribonuclease VII large subunit [Capsulimonadaceae bacterium]